MGVEPALRTCPCRWRPQPASAAPLQHPGLLTPPVLAVALLCQLRHYERPLRVAAVGRKGVVPVVHELLKLRHLAASRDGARREEA